MSTKELARIMRARGVSPRARTRSTRRDSPPATETPPKKRLVDTFQELPRGEENKPASVYRVPDAWEAPKSVQKKSLPSGEEGEIPELTLSPGPRKKADHKRRKTAVSICVSPEEEFYLRKHAVDSGMSFSEWARVVLFKSMKMPIPPRT